MSSSYNPAFVGANGGTTASAEAALLAGFQGYQSYLNIHTSAFPNGEIRANLAPEPAGTILLATGLAGLLPRKRWFARR